MINANTIYCDFSGCSNYTDVIHHAGWSKFHKKDLCPEHNLIPLPDVYPFDVYPFPEALEIRRVAVIPREGLDGAVPWGKQEAIPWCTTHKDLRKTCKVWGRDTCVFSYGGPDHKWWVDA